MEEEKVEELTEDKALKEELEKIKKEEEEVEKLIKEEGKTEEEKELEKIEKEISELEKEIKEREEKLSSEGSSEGEPKYPNVKKAVELENKGRKVGMITLWEDGKITMCVTSPHNEKVGGCYTIRDGDERLFYIAQAWFTGLSKDIKVKPIE